MLIFVTGKSGSGKSTFSKQLANKLNFKYIDIDEIGHKVYAYPEIMEKAYQLFGTEINDANGSFDRKKLGQIAFNERHSKRVKAFSDLTWKHMQSLIDSEIDGDCVVDWILLPHTKYWYGGGIRVLIKALNDNERLKKVMARDNITKNYALLRDRASIDYNETEFDFVFTNDYESDCSENVKEVINFVNSAIRLKVMGTQSPFSQENSACPSFMLNYGGHTLLLDCGSGSHRFYDMNNLKNMGIIISHLHRDHYNDLFNYMYSSYVMNNLKKLDKPINIFLPTQPTHIFEDIKNEKQSFSKVNEIIENKKYKLGDFEFEFIKTFHCNDILSYAVKIRVNSKVIVYTGDLSFSGKQEIINFAQNADILICEASLLEQYGFPKECNHLTAKQAAEIAKESKVKKLILTHFWPEEDVRNIYNEAKNMFNNVFIAKEKEIYLI